MGVPSIFLITLILTAFHQTTKSSEIDQIEFILNNITFVRKVDPRFLSFTLDSYLLAGHWKYTNLMNLKLIHLTRQLTPAYLRVGGTSQDDIYFGRGRRSQATIRITESDIHGLGQFVQDTGVDLIYGLNALERSGGKWNPANSIHLMKYMDNLRIPVAGWELGNEPLRFPKVYNRSVRAKQLSKDFYKLKSILKEMPRYSNSSIYGPDVTHISVNNGNYESDFFSSSSSIKFLTQFFKGLNNSTLSGVTFHDYSLSGKSSTILAFLDASIMDQLPQRIQLVTQTVQRFLPNCPVWLGETSSAWGGGSQMSDRFVSSFMWLDKLGQSALSGISVVARQTLTARTKYSLISKNYHPTPSYFVSFLFKKLVSPYVLRTNNNFVLYHPPNSTTGATIRLYLHCDAALEGGVVIFGMNLNPATPITVRIITTESSPITIYEYLVTAPDDDLMSKGCSLNGKLFQEGPTGIIPYLIPTLRSGGHFPIPSLSLGFWIIKDANVTVCRRNNNNKDKTN